MIDANRNGASHSANGSRHPTYAQLISQASEKPRGFLSFLTWPLLVAQVLAADHFFGRWMQSAAAEDQVTPGSPASEDESRKYEAEMLREPRLTAGAEDIVQRADTEAATTGNATIGNAARQNAEAGTAPSGLPDDDGPHARLRNDAEMGHATRAQSGGSHDTDAAANRADDLIDRVPGVADRPILDANRQPEDAGSESAAGAGPVSATIEHTDHVVESAPPALHTTADAAAGAAQDLLTTLQETAESIPPALHATVDAAAGAAQDLLTTLQETAESIPPALHATVDAAAGAAQDLLATAQSTAESVLPVVGDTLDTGSDALTTTDQVVESLSPVLHVSAGTAGDVVEDVLATASPAANSVLPELDDTVEAVSGSLESPPLSAASVDIVADGSLAGQDGGFLASDGMIAFDDEPAPAVDANGLFSGNRYTDYGIVLETDTADNANGASQSPETSGTEAADSQSGNQPDDERARTPEDDRDDFSSSTPASAGLTSDLDEVALRGSDGLI